MKFFGLFPRLLVSAFLGVAILGCAAAGFQPQTGFSKGEAQFFDDGIDLIEDLNALSGDWGFSARDELVGRVQLADLVAVVEIVSIQDFKDMDGKESRRIDLQVVETLYGRPPSKAFAVSATEQSTGFITILRNEHRLTGRKLAFVRFFLDEQGKLLSHFHLSPNSEAMRDSVDKLILGRNKEESPASRR
jgi:hypothetical protein